MHRPDQILNTCMIFEVELKSNTHFALANEMSVQTHEQTSAEHRVWGAVGGVA